MTVISNPLLLKKKAAAGGGDSAYQIEKSLRYNKLDDPKLNRNISTSNRRTFTISTWVKGTFINWNILYCHDGSGDYGGCRFAIDDNGILLFQEREDAGAYTNCDIRTSARLRDYSAWQHVVCAVDTTQTTDTDRVKLYINGVQQTSFGTSTWPSQNYELHINDGSLTNRIGGWHDAGTYYPSDIYFADFQFIDGLQLPPGAFGEFDSNTGVWNPKAFAIQKFNDGTVWSDGVSGTVYSDAYRAHYMFDGGIPKACFSEDGGQLTWTVPDAIKNNCNHKFELYIKCAGTTASNFLIDDVSYFHDVQDKVGAGSTGWYTLPMKNPSTIKWTRTDGTHKVEIRAVRVDGVWLHNGKKDSDFKNLNDGRTWQHASAGNAGTNIAFNGILRAHTQGTQDMTSYDEFCKEDLVVNDCIMFMMDDDKSITIKDGNNNEYNVVDGYNDHWRLLSNQSSDFTTNTAFTGTLTAPIYIKCDSGNDALQGVMVDGCHLVDSTVDNSFHLKFNDTSTNARLGRNSLTNKGIEDSSVNGALPIYNTTADSDGYDPGETKGSGYRTDSNAAGLKLAIPGDVLTDEHDHVTNATGSAVSITANGSIAVSTDQSRFYGSSIRFDGSDDYLYIAPPPFTISDRSTTYTVEAWVWCDSSVFTDNTYRSLFNAGGFHIGFYRSDASPSGSHIFAESDGNWNGFGMTSAQKCPKETWFHLAFVRNGTSQKLYINGLESASDTTSDTQTAETNWKIGSAASVNNWKGYVSDLKVYDTAIYTANFTPPTRNDFTVNNLLEAGGTDFTITNLGDSWHEALKTATAGSGSGGTPSSGTTLKSLLSSTGAPPDAGSRNQFWNYVSSNNNSSPITVEYNPPIPTTSEFSIYGGSYNNPATNWTATITYSDDTTASNSGSSGSNDWWARSSFSTSGKSVKKASIGSNSYANFMGVSADNSNNVVTHTGPENIDSLVDTPTNYGTASSPEVGGELRGNYCTLNSLDTYNAGSQISQGNLKIGEDADNYRTAGLTLQPKTGKWYYEATISSFDTSNSRPLIGFSDAAKKPSDRYKVNAAGNYLINFFAGGVQRSDNNSQTNISAMAQRKDGDVLQFAIDYDAKKCWIGSNNEWIAADGDLDGNPAAGSNETFGSATFLSNGILLFAGIYHGFLDLNFGQRAFKKTVPSGFKSLCTQNLDDTFSGEAAGTVNNPSKYFDTKLWTGVSGDLDVTSYDFRPDLVWIKRRSATNYNQLYDAIRGADDVLYSNADSAADNESNTALKAFLDNGFTLGDHTGVNDDDDTYVGWCWDAGIEAATVSDQGSITVTNSWVNATAGFEILKHTGTGANGTVGHNLGAKPDFIISKSTSSTDNWFIYHSSVGAEKYLMLNSQAAEADGATVWQDTEPTDTVYSVSTGGHNDSGVTLINYLWTAIPGYSSFGTYTGSGSDPNFIHLGFKPRYFLLRPIDADDDWRIFDSARSAYNPVNIQLKPNESSAEGSGSTLDMDFVSNGVRLQASLNTGINGSGTKFMYAAFAEHPFKLARAR